MKHNLNSGKGTLRVALTSLAVALTLVTAGHLLVGQQPADTVVLTPAEVQTLMDVQRQQKEILANMQEIETGLAAAAEDVRQARIFTSRGGSR